MARKTRRIKKRRSRFSTAIMQGVGICLVGYMPAWRWGNPMLAMGMTSLMMILVAVRLKTGRQGFIRGIILGTLAGIWIWAGMVSFHAQYVDNRMWGAEPHEIPQPEADDKDAAAKDDGATTDTTEDDSASADTTEPDGVTAEVESPDEPPEMTEVVPYPQDERDRDQAHLDKLPYRTIPPPMVICPLIGMVFADLANKRRIKARSMWD